MTEEEQRLQWARDWPEDVLAELDKARSKLDREAKELMGVRQQCDHAQALLRVALELLRVADFDTDFESQRAYDLETKIEALLVDAYLGS